jgi:hypothetical protein
MKRLFIVTSLILSTLATQAETLKPGIKCINEIGNVSFELRAEDAKESYELVRIVDARSTQVIAGLECDISGLLAKCKNNGAGDALETVTVSSATIEKAGNKGEARSLVMLKVKSANIAEVVKYTFSNGNGRCEASR